MSTTDRYVLATGAEGAHRLRVLNAVHGPDTEAFLVRAGLRPGMRVADIGCGIGTITSWIAEQVGPGGHVVGVDISEAQIDQARVRAAELGLSNAEFVAASAYATGLPSSSFDLVCCRFLLMHLTRPQDAVSEMARLVKKGGVLACEDGDFTSPFSEPPSAAYEHTFDLYRSVVAERGADPLIGPRIYRMMLEAGFAEPRITLAQSAFTRGEEKRLPEWTLSECAPALIEHGIASQEEIDRIAGELKTQAEDETTLFAMVRVAQVWGRK